MRVSTVALKGAVKGLGQLASGQERFHVGAGARAPEILRAPRFIC